MLPICPICGYHVSEKGCDMHEALITRGEAMGTDLLLAIMVQENCVLVHPGKCHKIAHTTEGRIKCAGHLIEEEGLSWVISWLNCLKPDFSIQHEINDAKEFICQARLIQNRKENLPV